MPSKILSPLQLETLMVEFSEEVAAGRYKKMGYNSWRILKSTFDDVEVKQFESALNIEYYPKDELFSSRTISFSIYDNSFGEFVNTKLFYNKTENEKENEKMKGFNFDFGPCTNDAVRISMYGIAVKNVAGTWVSYNPANDEIIDVDVFNFEGGRYMYKMPVAIKDIKVGDVVIHNRIPVFVTEVSEDFSSVIVVDIRAGERKEVIPTKNMFGFNFITKVVSLFDAFENAPTPEAPFGNMLPFLMMDGDNKDIDPMMMMLMMNGNGGKDLFSNPMMMYFMLKDNKDSDMLPLMFLMNSNK